MGGLLSGIVGVGAFVLKTVLVTLPLLAPALYIMIKNLLKRTDPDKGAFAFVSAVVILLAVLTVALNWGIVLYPLLGIGGFIAALFFRQNSNNYPLHYRFLAYLAITLDLILMLIWI